MRRLPRGSEFPGVALLLEVAGLFEELEQVLELFEDLAGFLAHQLLELVGVDVVDVAAVLDSLEGSLEFVELLHVAH